MSPTRSRLSRVLAFAALAVCVGTGCTERNMGRADNDGWTKVGTGSKAAQPSAPLQHAEAVNVTYYYLPG
jgi:hypothetical protein